MAHTYITGTYSGVKLNIIKTTASNIKLLSLRKASSMQGSSYYGINGGFFDGNSSRNINNIALYNGSVVEPYPDQIDRSGADNAFCGSGVSYYLGNVNAMGHRMGIQNINNSDITGVWQTNSWAQGGRGLSLGNTNWKSKETAHPFTQKWEYTSNGMSAMVFNNGTRDVYLIVYYGSTQISPTTFRTAIQTYLGISDSSNDNATYKGLLLDGGGSSQMKARHNAGDINVTGDGRRLVQIIALKNP